ncbi:unnamed protein product [Allacma fusca]|uniref:Saccharopine dehydrogenase NADP binding domain-containing protein n=1 Tax=Allacma fusca TaxID=39272 RepID=A0A8J2LRG8_9HEXA|nr:unnamed protein product [Allacma fusca]
MARKYDIIIFGASGYTGAYVVEEAVNCLKSGKNIPKFTWAVAGRSGKKLQETLDQVSKLTGVDVKNVDKIVADSGKPESLRQMAAQCSVVVNVVGPYDFYGEDVIKACLAEGTHHLDISGETQFLEKMQVLYSEEAKAKGVYIVGTCGYDSIPADCGVTYLQQNFEGEINSVENYASMGLKDTMKGGGLNTGTWNSAINYLASWRQLKELRKKLFPKPIPKPKYEVTQNWPIHNNKEARTWCIPFIGVDESVVERSQYLFHTEEKRRPIQFRAYSQFSYLIICLGLGFAMGVYFLLSQFQFGRDLLEKYPGLFTFGMVKSGGPTREQAANGTFKFILTAYGWSEKLAEPTDQHTTPPNKKMRLIIYGENPAYAATAKMLLQSAVTILEENDKMPSSGGVYPPGFAFDKTTLIPRIQSRGIEFRLINNW